jgi:hypothetical protein
MIGLTGDRIKLELFQKDVRRCSLAYAKTVRSHGDSAKNQAVSTHGRHRLTRRRKSGSRGYSNL